MEVEEVDMDKVRTAAAILRGAQALIPTMDADSDLVQEYWDVIGSQGGLSEADLEYLGIDVDTLTNVITLLENYHKFTEGEANTLSQYRVTLNAIRRANVQV